MEFQELVEESANIEVTYHVSDDVYFGFQRISSDYNPLHTDEAFAKSKGFLERVMYGNILNAFVSHFVGMALPTRDLMIQTQDIQFRKPVYLGDTVVLKSSVEETSAAVKIIIFKLRFYRKVNKKQELVATGHVQIGMLHNKH